MASSIIHDVYDRHIRSLSADERLRLAALILEDLAERGEGGERGEPQYSVLDFYGAAAHNPIGMDAQEYVNQMRDEWDHRP
jgi:hypothetical protein